jgi:hypothetical protein
VLDWFIFHFNDIFNDEFKNILIAKNYIFKFKFHKNMFQRNRSFRVSYFGSVTYWRIFCPRIAYTRPPRTATLAVRRKNRINGDSTGNHQLIEVEYTGGMVIPPGNCP